MGEVSARTNRLPVRKRVGNYKSDGGFTLVELLVYVSLLVIVLFVLGGMLISSVTVQRTVTGASDETKLGQLISRSIGVGIRNGTAFRVDPGVSTNDQILRARSSVVKVSGGTTTTTWRCMAWYYRASDGAFFSTSKSGAAVPLPGAVAPATALSSWTYYGSGVKPLAGATTVLSGSAPALNLSFTVAVGNAPPVQIATVYNLRVQNDTTTGPTTCF